MKKAMTLGLLLVLALALGLAACGGTDEASTTTTATPATTVAPATTATTAGAETTTTAAAANAQEPIKIKYACTGQEAETVGQEVKFFTDYVTKAVPAVTFDIYFGGTLASGVEDLPLLSSGGVDMISLGHPPYAELLPLLCAVPMFAPGNAATQPTAGVDYYNTLCFDDPTTSALITAEAEKNNVKYIAWMTTGASVFEAKKPFTKLADLKGQKFANGGDPAPYQALGLSVVQLFPPDIYEALRTGVADSTSMGFAPIVSALKWYEVAPYFMWDNTVGAGQCITINLDVWNKLTPETQAIFMEAGKATSEFSIQLDAKQTAEGVKTVEAAGGSVIDMPAEDAAMYYPLIFKSAADGAYKNAAAKGNQADVLTVLSKAAELCGVTWAPPAE